VAHAVFAVAPCAILVADDDDRIVAANAQADALFATGAGGLVGHRLDRVLPLRWRDGGSASAADAAGRWHDPAYSGRATVGLGLDGTYFRLHLASAPVPLSYGTGVLVTASAVDEDADRVGDGSGELLVDLDAALRRIFAAGLTLTGVRERLDRDGVPARALAGVIADLDRAAGELRQAGRST
jgi:PAS domain-containing protein